MDLQAEFDRLMELCLESFRSGQKRRSAEAARAAVKIAEAMGDHQRRVHALSWEGVSWADVDEKETALVLLLDAANATHPQVDPADTFNAQARLIEIALEIKVRSDVINLIDSSRRFLEQIGKERWDHKLDLLQGTLEWSRGEYCLAFDYCLRSWHRHSKDYPNYTQASHLYALCRTSFGLRDTERLKRYLEEWVRCRPETEGDEMRKLAAECLLARGERTWQSDPEQTLGSSRTLLRRASMVDFKMHECLDAIRSLALCGAFEEVKQQWNRYSSKLKQPDFWDRLCEADLDLMYARSLAGMPPIDDEWDTEFPAPQPPFAKLSGCSIELDRCEAVYHKLFDLAAKEDARLETGHYSRTLRERLERVRIMRVALEVNP